MNSDRHNWQLLFIVSHKVTHITSHHLHYRVAQNVGLQHERKCIDAGATPLTKSAFNNRVTHSSPLAVNASSMFEILVR